MRSNPVRQITRKVAIALVKTGGTVAAMHGKNPNPYMITKKNGHRLPLNVNTRFYAYSVNIEDSRIGRNFSDDMHDALSYCDDLRNK